MTSTAVADNSVRGGSSAGTASNPASGDSTQPGAVTPGIVAGSTPSVSAPTGAAPAASSAPGLGTQLNEVGTQTAQQSTSHSYARGVTAKTITVGVLYLVGFDSAASTFGFGGATTGDVKADATAIINEINSHGGVAGHQIVPVWAPFQSVDNQDQHPALCQQLTQDNQVFAVLSMINMDVEFAACFRKAHMPLIDDAGGLTAAQLQGLVSISAGEPLNERTYRDEIAAMIQRQFLTPANKIGLLWVGTDEATQLVKATVEPTLQSDGLHVVSTFAASNDSSQVASYGSAVLQFERDGVDMVISVGSSPIFFMNDAESQRYYPHYILNSDFGPGALLQTAVQGGSDQLKNSVGMGWQPYSDVDAAHNPGPVSANETRCLKIMSRAGLSTSSTLAILVQVQMCDAFFLFQAALQHPADLTVAGLVNATHALGQSYLSSATFRTSFASRLDGPAATRDFSYFTSCNCFQYDRPLAPLA